jgi:hypothetical protein
MIVILKKLKGFLIVSKFETNENGQLLCNIEDIFQEKFDTGSPTFEGFTRYNGGWIKTVTGLNKTITNGYSVLGTFAQAQITWNSPGLYLDCSIGGSRKNHEPRYQLFILHKDGSISGVGEQLKNPGKDWAVKLWPLIERTLKDPDFTEPSKEISDSQELEALILKRSQLQAQLEAIEGKIQALQNKITQNEG